MIVSHDVWRSTVAWPATTILQEYQLVSVRLDARPERAHLEVGFSPRWSENHYVVVYLDDWERAGSSIDS